MFRLWGKIWKDNRMQQDTTYEEDSNDTRTHKVLRGLEQICMELDLSVPLWLDNNIKDFKKHARARFTQDSFIESIPFDCLEIQVIEED